MAAAAGRKAIKVIACSSHNLADTARSFSDQLHQFHFSCLALHKNELEVFSGIWESLELQWERPPNYWSPIFLFSRRVWGEMEEVFFSKARLPIRQSNKSSLSAEERNLATWKSVEGKLKAQRSKTFFWERPSICVSCKSLFVSTARCSSGLRYIPSHSHAQGCYVPPSQMALF